MSPCSLAITCHSQGELRNKVKVFVVVFLEVRLHLAALHCLVAVHKESGKPGRPIIGKFSGHFPVQSFCLLCELAIVVLLVPDCSQEVAHTPAPVAAVLPQVFSHSRLKKGVPVTLGHLLPVSLHCCKNNTAVLLLVYSVGHLLQESENLLSHPEDRVT